MNAGAAVAQGEMLVFLHADTLILFDLERVVSACTDNEFAWGRFDVRLSGRHPLLRVIEYFMNLRSRLTGIATGDQTIFVTRRLFSRVNGFPQIALMEDIALSVLLRSACKPLCLPEKVISSSRRWEERGIIKTVIKMWCLRARYYFGADPDVLAGKYN
jgi:rSAM/selenodomain-associated transferase 2